MNTEPSEEAKFLLHKLLVRHGGQLASRYTWVWEQSRWHELVVALMLLVIERSEDEIRRLVAYMVNLQLLEISSLASNDGEEHRKRTLELLREEGVEPAQASKAVKLLEEAADGFQKHFTGSTAQYFRSYGEAMLSDVDQQFRFSGIDKSLVRQAFVYWLQNTLSMPLSLSGREMRDFCSHHKLTEQEVINAADELGLNIALLDDLIAMHLAPSQKAESLGTRRKATRGKGKRKSR
jgi:hypothetical protein